MMQFRRFIGAGCVVALAVAAGACGSEGGFADARPIDAPTPGTVSVSWTLRDSLGAQIECDQIGPNVSINLELVPRGGGRGEAESLSCTNNPATSRKLPPGIYNVSFVLRAQDLTPASATPQADVEVLPDGNTVLAPIEFQIDVRGTLVLSLRAPPAVRNCSGAAGSTAGIDSNTLTLLTRGACAPVTFVRRQGATIVNTYVVNCGSPVSATCIETNETLTAEGITSGSYLVTARGRTGTVDCYATENQLVRVPAQGRAVVDTINLGKTGAPGC